MPGNRLPWIVLEWELEGARRNAKHKEMDGVRQRTAKYGLTEDTREGDRWKT
jgi:hypothetical protein